MDKHDWSSFLRFLDEASDEELGRYKGELDRLLGRLTEPGVKSDVRRMRRLLDEEVLARLRPSLPSPATASSSTPERGD